MIKDLILLLIITSIGIRYAVDDEKGFKIDNFNILKQHKLENGFIVRENNIWYNVKDKSNEIFITRMTEKAYLQHN